MSNQPIRIGTRSSPLALWQAQLVQNELKKEQVLTELIPIQSLGDQNSTQPLYEMNVQGIFTKALDQALIDHRIDIAVHSFKDMPTQFPKGITILAVLERGPASDLLVYTSKEKEWPKSATIGTSSLRRSAQWKSRYPQHQTTTLRGNVQRRLQTLKESDWIGALFAKAGLERINQIPTSSQVLEWMIPAPAQGAICVVGRTDELDSFAAVKRLNCETTFRATQQERHFLRRLEGGCTAPIGALLRPKKDGWHFKGGVFSLDGTEKAVYENYFSKEAWEQIGEQAAQAVLDNGGAAIMSELKTK